MKAPWKQTPLEQAQKRTPASDQAKQIVELKAEIARMKAGKDMLLRKVQALDDACGRWRSVADEYERNNNRYDLLRELDVMVMDKDGAKYLKGEELDNYVDNYRGLRLSGDIYSRISKSYQQQLAASMVQTRSVAMSEVLGTPYEYKTYSLGSMFTEDNDGSNP